MQYTIRSRGVPIGVTDLGFARIPELDRNRVGWFHPNAEGERLMPVIAAVLPTLRACGRRARPLEAAEPNGRSRLRGSAELADLAEALHHVEALDLTLHLEDGSLVPTESIGLRDTEELLSLAREAEAEADLGEMLGGLPDEPAPFPGDEDGGEERECGSLVDDDAWGPSEPWTPDEEPAHFPRYQVNVQMADGVELP